MPDQEKQQEQEPKQETEVELPLTPEDCIARIQELGATIMFEKVLTTSDASGAGRIVIPKSVAETNFPHVETQDGAIITLIDVFGKTHTFRYRFWINNTSRMYIIEGTQALQNQFKLTVGDVLVFARHPDTNIYVCGRKGTKEDAMKKPVRRSGSAAGERKTATPGKGKKRSASAAGISSGEQPLAATSDASLGSDKGTDTQTVDAINKAATGGMRSRKFLQKQEEATSAALAQGNAEVEMLYSYWNAASLPAKRDGVFRAVPPNTGVEPNTVSTMHGYWTAVVMLGGEMYQAFFDSAEAAEAAMSAARQ